MIRITLTPAQVDRARWALGAVESLGPQEFEELGYTEEDAPTIEGRSLVFKPGRAGAEAAGDMVYRVGYQLTDIMAAEIGGDVKNLAGNNLAEKIRAAYADRYMISGFGELTEVTP